eukprot:3971034-Amphidinium_carterae.1
MVVCSRIGCNTGCSNGMPPSQCSGSRGPATLCLKYMQSNTRRPKPSKSLSLFASAVWGVHNQP